MHAILDDDGNQTAIYHDEGAAEIADSRYLPASCNSVSLVGDDLATVADEPLTRAAVESLPARATGKQMNRAKEAIRKLGYETGPYTNDGF